MGMRGLNTVNDVLAAETETREGSGQVTRHAKGRVGRIKRDGVGGNLMNSKICMRVYWRREVDPVLCVVSMYAMHVRYVWAMGEGGANQCRVRDGGGGKWMMGRGNLVPA